MPAGILPINETKYSRMDQLRFVDDSFSPFLSPFLNTLAQIMVNVAVVCTKCDVGVAGDVKSICCDFCDIWFHRYCSGLSLKQFFEILKADYFGWCCHFYRD